MNLSYVTYDSTGKLAGAFLQSIQPEHEAAHIIVTDDERLAWVNYRANAERTGIELAPAIAETEVQARARFKAERAVLVAAIVVTVDALPFDGDEISQSRMARAILALQAADVTSTTWVLADNRPAEVTLGQLQQALIASGLAQSALWVAP
jgi:hypothetical protein